MKAVDKAMVNVKEELKRGKVKLPPNNMNSNEAIEFVLDIGHIQPSLWNMRAEVFKAERDSRARLLELEKEDKESFSN